MPTEQEQRHIDTAHAYLAAVDAFDPDAAALHLAPDVVQTDFPNVMTPTMKERGREGVLTGTREAGYFLQSQRTAVTRTVADGDEVAIEAVWTGVLKFEMGPLKIGDTLRVYMASCFTFRDGKIAAQRTYNCVDVTPP